MNFKKNELNIEKIKEIVSGLEKSIQNLGKSKKFQSLSEELKNQISSQKDKLKKIREILKRQAYIQQINQTSLNIDNLYDIITKDLNDETIENSSDSIQTSKNNLIEFLKKT